jgi:hypothetical protein
MCDVPKPGHDGDRDGFDDLVDADNNNDGQVDHPWEEYEEYETLAPSASPSAFLASAEYEPEGRRRLAQTKWGEKEKKKKRRVPRKILCEGKHSVAESLCRCCRRDGLSASDGGLAKQSDVCI